MSKASLDFINSGKCYPSEVLNYVLELEQQNNALEQYLRIEKEVSNETIEELEQQKAELFANLRMAMDNDKRKLYKEEILKTIEKYKTGGER